MIEDHTVEMAGKLYDLSCQVPDELRRLWLWSDAATNEEVPRSLEQRLNQLFVEKHAGTVAKQLTDTADRGRFYRILTKMSANAEQLKTAGFVELEDELLSNDSLGSPLVTSPTDAQSPFNSKELRDWFVPKASVKVLTEVLLGQISNDDGTILKTGEVGLLGYGPFEFDDFKHFLFSRGTASCDVTRDTEVVILGCEGWDEAEIDDLIDSRVGRRLRIYSQEMFISYLANQVDPLTAPSGVLEAFKVGHAGLEFVSQGWRGWVATTVSKDWRHSVGDTTSFHFENNETPWYTMGYRVGKSRGKKESDRRIILREFFVKATEVKGEDVTEIWGMPSSGQRLRMMADHLAYLIDDRQRYPEAVDDWGADLAWMRNEFYHGHYDFEWPG